jgi:hypothetical protein
MTNQCKVLLTVLILATATYAPAQANGTKQSLPVAQVVALDECDPTTFKLPSGQTSARTSHWERLRRSRICLQRLRPELRIPTGILNLTY